MGITTSRRSGGVAGRLNGEADAPRYASLYHSWMGYLGFFLQLVLGLMTFSMLIGQWQSSSTVTLLAFVIIYWVVYVIFCIVNSVWYGPTFTSRLYWGIDPEGLYRVLRDTPTYDRMIARDLKFHNDQWHFSVGVFGYFFIMLFLAIFLGIAGTANPSPDFNTAATVYSATANSNFVIIKLFQLIVLGVAGFLSIILFSTMACFMHSTMINLNLQATDNIRTPSELPDQPGQVNTAGLPSNTRFATPSPNVATTGIQKTVGLSRNYV